MKKDNNDNIKVKSVWPLIAKVKADLDDIPREKWIWKSAQLSRGGKPYEYRSFHELMSKISPLLLKHGLHIFFEATRQIPIQPSEWDPILTGKVSFELRLVVLCTDESKDLGPAVISLPAVGEDKNDISKALGKANTYTKRYLLLNLFSLSVPEETVEDEAEREGLRGEQVSGQFVGTRDRPKPSRHKPRVEVKPQIVAADGEILFDQDETEIQNLTRDRTRQS